MKKDIKIFVSHRIDLDSEIIDNPLFVPVRCGAVFDKRENVPMLGDDTGDNISEKRMSFCELTVQYWAWKNVEADYYGLCHYRRYLSFKDKLEKNTNIYNHIEENTLHDGFCEEYEINYDKASYYLNNYDILKIMPMILPVSEKSVYNSIVKNKRTYDKDGIDLFIKILKNKYPELASYTDDYMNGNLWYGWNCYVLSKKYFFDYSNKLFDVLFELERQINSKYYNIEQIRMIGYMGECMFPIYCRYIEEKFGAKTYELPLIEIKKPKLNKKVKPIYDASVNIAITSSDEYVPFLSVLLESIGENSSNQVKYDIIILENGISDYNKTLLIQQIKKFSNISIRFKNIEVYLCENEFYVREHITPMTYIRLAVLDIFALYEKIIYLDCDTIVNYDLANLYDIDISDYCIAAVRDTVMAGWSNSLDEYKEYYKKLKLKDKFSYFNGGVLVFNIRKIREEYTSTDLFRVATSQKWKWFDQDVLNFLFTNKVKLLKQNWNYMSHVHSGLYDLPEYYAPKKIYENYIEAANSPYIVHYAGRTIPCFQPDTDLAEIFWKYARNSPYYEKILYKMAIDTSSRVYYFSQLKNRYISRIKKFLKIFFPVGTSRYRILRNIYLKLRG